MIVEFLGPLNDFVVVYKKNQQFWKHVRCMEGEYIIGTYTVRLVFQQSGIEHNLSMYQKTSVIYITCTSKWCYEFKT